MNKMTLSINGGAFVIPNDSRRFKSFNNMSGSKYTADYLIELARLNNIELTGEDKIIQMWFHSKEVNCDNICDHGFTINENGEKIYVKAYKLQWVPEKLLRGMKEGETLKLIVPGVTIYRDKLSSIRNDQSEEGIMTISAVCQQQGYRYARFGKFEEVVKNV